MPVLAELDSSEEVAGPALARSVSIYVLFGAPPNSVCTRKDLKNSYAPFTGIVDTVGSENEIVFLTVFSVFVWYKYSLFVSIAHYMGTRESVSNERIGIEKIFMVFWVGASTPEFSLFSIQFASRHLRHSA